METFQRHFHFAPPQHRVDGLAAAHASIAAPLAEAA
jgi:hypothetical protein